MSNDTTITGIIATRFSDMHKAAPGAGIVLLNDSENFVAYQADAHRAWGCLKAQHAKGRFGSSKLRSLADHTYEWQVPLAEVRAVITILRESYTVAIVERISRPAGTFGPPFACIWMVEKIVSEEEDMGDYL